MTGDPLSLAQFEAPHFQEYLDGLAAGLSHVLLTDSRDARDVVLAHISKHHRLANTQRRRAELLRAAAEAAATPAAAALAAEARTAPLTLPALKDWPAWWAEATPLLDALGGESGARSECVGVAVWPACGRRAHVRWEAPPGGPERTADTVWLERLLALARALRASPTQRARLALLTEMQQLDVVRLAPTLFLGRDRVYALRVPPEPLAAAPGIPPPEDPEGIATEPASADQIEDDPAHRLAREFAGSEVLVINLADRQGALSLLGLAELPEPSPEECAQCAEEASPQVEEAQA